MQIRFDALIALGLSLCFSSQAQTPLPSPSIGAQLKVHGLLWDAHEVTVAQVKRFAQSTGFVSRAEKEGGGYIYESGFVLKKGWTWRAPFGIPAQDNEPAVHLTFDEAQKFVNTKASVCRVTASGSMPLMLSKDLKLQQDSIKESATSIPTVKVRAKAIA